MSTIVTTVQATFARFLNPQSSKTTSGQSPDQVRVCNRHQVAFTRYEKDGKVAYLHTESQGWCRDSESHVTDGKVVVAA